MVALLRVPEVAAGETQAVLAQWLVTPGVEFAAGEAIALLETDKAAVEVEAEAGAQLLRTLAEPGTTVEVGAPIAVLGAPSERDDVDGFLAASGLTGPVRTSEPTRVFSSPLARKMLKEAGISPDVGTGTGPNGRIVRRDVERVITETRESPDVPAVVAAPASEAFTELPHSRLRTAIANRLTVAKQTVPHYYLRRTARVDRLLGLRRELNAVSPVKISVNDLVVRALAAGYRAVPEANVTWTEQNLRQYARVDLGVAIASTRGLVTPVLHDVLGTAPGEVAARVRDFAARADEGRLRQHELEGGVATVSNLGMYGVDEFAAIVNPPQSAILAVGAAKPAPFVVDGAIEVGTSLALTLSVDHRAVDGALGARLLDAVVRALENPMSLLV
ncbi:dihydrolipoamide acetyltransferase family protein [Amycolatopsis sp. NPDC004747]